MTPLTQNTLHRLNRIYLKLGYWQDVAGRMAVNRATINKWFAGTRTPNRTSREIVKLVHLRLLGWLD